MQGCCGSRSFFTKEEKVEMLKEYKESLEKEFISRYFFLKIEDRIHVPENLHIDETIRGQFIPGANYPSPESYTQPQTIAQSGTTYIINAPSGKTMYSYGKIEFGNVPLVGKPGKTKAISRMINLPPTETPGKFEFIIYYNGGYRMKKIRFIPDNTIIAAKEFSIDDTVMIQ